MGELFFISDKLDPNDRQGKKLLPYRYYEALDMRFLFAREGISHLTPDKADLSRLPEDLPEPVVRAVTGFVNDAKVHGRWFCIKDGDLHDDQDEDILTAAVYAFEDDADTHLIMPYKINNSDGWHGPSPLLVKLLCTDG